MPCRILRFCIVPVPLTPTPLPLSTGGEGRNRRCLRRETYELETALNNQHLAWSLRVRTRNADLYVTAQDIKEAE